MHDTLRHHHAAWQPISNRLKGRVFSLDGPATSYERILLFSFHDNNISVIWPEVASYKPSDDLT